MKKKVKMMISFSGITAKGILFEGNCEKEVEVKNAQELEEEMDKFEEEVTADNADINIDDFWHIDVADGNEGKETEDGCEN